MKSEKYQKISQHVGEKERLWKKAKKYKKRKNLSGIVALISFLLMSINKMFWVLVIIFLIPLIIYGLKYDQTKKKAQM